MAKRSLIWGNLYDRRNCFSGQTVKLLQFYSMCQKMAHVAATFTAEKKINYGERFI